MDYVNLFQLQTGTISVMPLQKQVRRLPSDTKFHRECIKSNRRSNRMSSAWKDALKERCLENARKRRLLVHLQKRGNASIAVASSSAFTDNSSNSDCTGGTLSRSVPTSVIKSSSSLPYNLGGTARQLVEEQLLSSKVGIMTSSNSLSSNSDTTSTHTSLIPNSSSPPHIPPSSKTFNPTNSTFFRERTQMFQNNNPMGINQIPIYSQNLGKPQEKQKVEGKGVVNFIDEDDLYELMQEVEEELNKEAQAFVDEEMSAMDAEQEQQDQIMQAQIEEYEEWQQNMMIL